MDRDARAIDEAKKGQSVELLIHKIRDGKLAIVAGEMTAPIDGVKGSEWYQDLDCVDVELKLAEQDERGHFFHHAEVFLDVAKRCKQALENDLHKASEQAQCAGHAMLGNIYGGQAHELVADFTFSRASAEFSLTVPAGYQIIGGQASNAASSTGYSCSLNSTNTTVD